MAGRKGDEAGSSYQPPAKPLAIPASPWTMLPLHRLHTEGPVRFGELRRRLGPISTRTLTERVRRLASEGWVTRDCQPMVPPKVTCALTEKVLELDGVMIELDRNLAAQFGKAGRWGAGLAAGPGRRLI